MKTKFTVTLPEGVASRLLAMSRSNPALRIHQTHTAVLRVGLRLLEATPELLTSELTQMADERPVRAGRTARAVTR